MDKTIDDFPNGAEIVIQNVGHVVSVLFPETAEEFVERSRVYEEAGINTCKHDEHSSGE